MALNAPRILVVDDERGLCTGVQEALKREGYVVDAANDSRTALKLMGERLYNLVLTDMKMPDLSGLQLLKEAKQNSRDTFGLRLNVSQIACSRPPDPITSMFIFCFYFFGNTL